MQILKTFANIFALMGAALALLLMFVLAGAVGSFPPEVAWFLIPVMTFGASAYCGFTNQKKQICVGAGVVVCLGVALLILCAPNAFFPTFFVIMAAVQMVGHLLRLFEK